VSILPAALSWGQSTRETHSLDGHSGSRERRSRGLEQMSDPRCTRSCIRCWDSMRGGGDAILLDGKSRRWRLARPMVVTMDTLKRLLWGALLVTGLLLAGPAHEFVHLCASVAAHRADDHACGGSSSDSSGHEGAPDADDGAENDCVLCHVGLDRPPLVSSPSPATEWTPHALPLIDAWIPDGRCTRGPPNRGPPARA
jgi:hypothetical protein